MQFPSTQGTSLAGRPYALPGQLEGRWNIVALGFERSHQDDIDTWMPTLHTLEARHPDLRCYTVPVLARSGGLLRWYQDTMLRMAIFDQDARARVIPIYVAKPDFCRQIGLAEERQSCLLLLDRIGQIHWRAQGACQHEDAERLAAELRVRQPILTPFTAGAVERWSGRATER